VFYRATNDAVTAAGAGVSCSTCHFQGRNDGLTWGLPEGPRQTPSLAGQTAFTAPYTWEGTVSSVAEEATLTASERMGGSGLSEEDAAAAEALVATFRLPAPHVAASSDVAEGAELFGRFGCTSCHVPPSYTDGLTHSIGGMDVDTPTLLGISRSAPYHHDGSSADLTDVLHRAERGWMGEPFDATDAEIASMVDWLQTL
jgi:cytochrome c peroxidase